MVEGVKSSFQAFKHEKPSCCLSPKIFQMVKITSWVDVQNDFSSKTCDSSFFLMKMVWFVKMVKEYSLS